MWIPTIVIIFIVVWALSRGNGSQKIEELEDRINELEGRGDWDDSDSTSDEWYEEEKKKRETSTPPKAK